MENEGRELIEKTIYVSEGFKEYVGGLVNEKTGKDISADTIQVALGTREAPPNTGWVNPDVNEVVNTSTRRIKKLIDNTVTEGTYWLWLKISDNPEVIPERIDIAIIVR